MSSTTPNELLPYPNLADAPDGPAGFGGLATTLDTIIAALRVRQNADEAAWTAFTPTWTSVASGPPTVGIGGGATFGGRWHQRGKTIEGCVSLLWGTSGINSGTGVWDFGLPTASLAIRGVLGSWTYKDVSTGDRSQGGVIQMSTTTVQLMYGTAGPLTVLQVNEPAVHQAGDTLEFNFLYEAA